MFMCMTSAVLLPQYGDEAGLLKVRRRDSPNLASDDAESWRICELVLQQRGAVTVVVARGRKSPVRIEMVDTSSNSIQFPPSLPV